MAGFDVTNWVTFPNYSFARVKVGRLDPQAPRSKELTLYDDQIVWHKSFNQVRHGNRCLGLHKNWEERHFSHFKVLPSLKILTGPRLHENAILSICSWE